jgi:hypothetical protein
LICRDPQALQQEGRQKACGNALGQIEAETAKNSKPVGHHYQASYSSLNGWAGDLSPNASEPPRRAARLAESR